MQGRDKETGKDRMDKKYTITVSGTGYINNYLTFQTSRSSCIRLNGEK